MTTERFRTEPKAYRRTSLVDVPSGAALAELRIPADRRGWVVVAHDGAHDPSFAVEDLNRNGLATLCLRLDGAANAMRLVETVAWLKRSVAEAQGLPAGLMGFGAAASAALSAAAVLGNKLGALVTVNASPDLAKLRLNGVNTFSLLIADAEHAGVNRRAVQRVRGVSRLEIADGSLEEAARVYGAAWLSGHLGAAGAKAPVRGMLTRLVGSWRMPKLWLGAPSRAAAAFLLAAGAYFASAPDAQAATTSNFSAGVLDVVLDGTDTALSILSSSGNVKINGNDPDSGVLPASVVSAIHVTGSGVAENIDLISVNSADFNLVSEIVIDGGGGNDTLRGGSDIGSSLIGGAGADNLQAGTGNDTLVSEGDGSDVFVVGANGDDLVIVEGGTALGPSVLGGTGNDTLRFEGTAGDDTLQVTSFGTGFVQVEVLGLGGNDTLSSTTPSATTNLILNGGDGNDQISGPNTGTFAAISLLGGDGRDTISGSSQAETIEGGDDIDSLMGGFGNDKIFGDNSTGFGQPGGNDTLDGGDGGDTLSGGYGNDSILGGAGNDSIFGESDGDSVGGTLVSNDTVDGGAGFDTIEAGEGDDSVLGGDDDDFICGDWFFEDREPFNGSDIIDGGNGNDSLFGGGRADVILGGAGNDSLFGDSGNDLLSGGDDNDLLVPGTDDDTVLGGAGDDTFDDQAGGSDSMAGGTGNDSYFLIPGSDDIVDDIGGLDTLSFGSASLGVRVNLDEKGVRQSIDDNDNGLTLFGVFEGWVGSSRSDELFLSPLVAPRTVDGGAHDSIGSGDILHYDEKGFGVTDNGSVLTPTVGGFGVVNYTNFEVVDITDSFDPTDIDGDSIPNSLDLDNDNDGIPDSKDPDKDGDGWDDDIELDEGTNPLDPTDFPDDSIVGGSGDDTDSDGIPDEIEDALSTDLDPSTSPGQMSVSKFTGKLKFPGVLKDALAFKTRLALPAGFTLDGAHLIVDIGGVVKEFDLDSKGKSDKLDKINKAKVKLLPAKKQTLAGATLADLQVTLKTQDFAGDLADEGLDGTASDTPSEHLVMLFVIANDAPYKAVKKVLYTNKSGTSGSFKSGKPLKELP